MMENQIKVYINHQECDAVAFNDRGLSYGDGFFTTAKCVNGQVEHWQLHKNRLHECQLRLGFEELDFNAIENDIRQLCYDGALCVVKIIITRGCQGRGYSPDPCSPLTYIISKSPFPTNYHQLKHTGISLQVAETRLGIQPLLAGLKTLNRLEQVLIKKEIYDKKWDDAIVLNINQQVIETSMANILCFYQGKWFSPSLVHSGIKGVFQQYLMNNNDIEFTTFSLAKLNTMDAIFCCNSLMGLVPVIQVGSKKFDILSAQNIADLWLNYD